MPNIAKPAYQNSVFINCPFDSDYTPMLRATIFAVYSCGFYPRTALAEIDSSDFRLEKIKRLIESCRYGIHDISRVGLDNDSQLPRFNMPFELGLFFGAKRFGDDRQKGKIAMVLDVEKYRYQTFISDLNGVDISVHEGNPERVIQLTRNWLNVGSKRRSIPGHKNIIDAYRNFKDNLPEAVEQMGLDIDSLHFNDFCTLVERYIRNVN